METSICSSCLKSKSTYTCGICKITICKGCAQFIDDDSFSFLKKIPPELAFSIYCGTCFDSQVGPELMNYDRMMEQAKNIHVYEKTQGKETRFIKRGKELYKVVDCPDRSQAVLRLAFFAAGDGYNALVDVNLSSEKVRDESYQKLKWSGTARPANIKERMQSDNLIRSFSSDYL